MVGSAGCGQEVSQQPGAAWRLSRSLNVSLTLAAISHPWPRPIPPKLHFKRSPGIHQLVVNNYQVTRWCWGLLGKHRLFQKPKGAGKSQLASNPLEADKGALRGEARAGAKGSLRPLSKRLPRPHPLMLSTGSFIREPRTIEVRYYKVGKLRHPARKMRVQIAVLRHLQTLMFRPSPFPAA